MPYLFPKPETAVPQLRSEAVQSGNPSTGVSQPHVTRVEISSFPGVGPLPLSTQISPSLSRNSVPISIHPLFERALPTRLHYPSFPPRASREPVALLAFFDSLVPESTRNSIAFAGSSDHPPPNITFSVAKHHVQFPFSRITLHRTRAAVAYPLQPRLPPLSTRATRQLSAGGDRDFQPRVHLEIPTTPKLSCLLMN